MPEKAPGFFIEMDPATPTSSSFVEFRDVTFGYGARAILDGVSFSVPRGKVTALMGASGGGKTTVLRLIGGQQRAQRGEVLFDGKDVGRFDVATLYAARRRMGMLFQFGALFTDISVFDNVAFPLREHTRIGEAELTDRVLDKLDAVGLRAAAHLKVSEISGGMARRVALARAVVLEPELILYDEPFAGLDPISLGITARLIRSLADRLGCASVLITHDVQESFAIADQVYLVGRGQLAAAGTPQMLAASPDPYVQQFLKGQPDGPVAFQYPETPAFQKWLSQQKGRKA